MSKKKNFKNLVKFVTACSVTINTVMIFSIIVFETCTFGMFVNVLWALSNVWNILAIYGNMFYCKPKKKRRKIDLSKHEKIIMFRKRVKE